jgi:hypothetical protein
VCLIIRQELDASISSGQHASIGIGSPLHAMANSCIAASRERGSLLLLICPEPPGQMTLSATHMTGQTDVKPSTHAHRPGQAACTSVFKFSTRLQDYPSLIGGFDRLPKGQKALTVYVVVVIEASVVRHIVCSTHANSG